ncbi:MAG: Fe(3+) ABC transporter substrate-binding protein [Gammaproteobacteria bacterium]|nr:MAG: Fe(3+) ABC transporter substrate-binding protein [Gammaproteobacteria bacterium]
MCNQPFVARLLIAVTLFSGVITSSLAEDKVVHLYSARNEALIKPMLDRFTEKTGIEVKLITSKADALLKRLETEGRNSPADVLLTTDAGRLHRAREAGVLQPVTSDILSKAIPAQYRDVDGYWFGLSLRARPIVYAKDRVNPAKELSTYEALAEPAMKGRVCIRSSDNIYNQSLVASMISTRGEAATEAWARAFVKNFARPPKGGDRDQVKAVAAGQCDVAVINTYYLGVMLAGDKADERQAGEKVAVFWPNQNDRGTHVNVSGAGVTAHAKHKENAIKLIEFLASEEAQAWYASVNHEYPVIDNVTSSELLKSWGTFKADSINLTELGRLNADAVRLMDRAGWR